MSDISVDGIPVVLLSRHQLDHYSDGLPGWGNRVLEKLGAQQAHFGVKLVIFSGDRELEFQEVGHA